MLLLLLGAMIHPHANAVGWAERGVQGVLVANRIGLLKKGMTWQEVQRVLKMEDTQFTAFYVTALSTISYYDFGPFELYVMYRWDPVKHSVQVFEEVRFRLKGFP